MSNHPYGLRGDPFASPATLSAKDASRLIRRRVRAFNGDGGALFPVDTCDLIHELAGGLPDAMINLAGRALRLAAAEGAPEVGTAHVTAAAETATAPAADARSGEAPAHNQPPVRSTTRDARFEADAEAPQRGETGVPRPAARGIPTTVAHDVIARVTDHDDIPPMPSCGFALPIRPSEELDQDARSWVSRFIPEPAVFPEGSSVSMGGRAPVYRDAAQVESSSSPAPMAEETPAPVYSASAAPRARRSRRDRRGGSSNHGGLLFALAAVGIVAFVSFQSRRANFDRETDGPVPTAARPVEAPVPGRVPEPASSISQVLEPTPTVTPEPVAPAPATVAPPVPAPLPSAVARTLPTAYAVTPAAVEAPRRERTSGKFALEVASFIFEERARAERDRLTSAGLRARIVTAHENGSRVYRVVVGGFPHPAAAERAADSLLAGGVVMQARVVQSGSGR